MKRIQSACICQILHFQLKEGVDPVYGAKAVREEADHYKKQLDRSKTQYKILEEKTLPDGSVMIKIIKQYNQSPVGDYLK